MKISLNLLFLGTLFLCIACGTNPKGPFFWTVEKEGQILHILGTIHLGMGLEDLQCSQVISKSLKQSDLLWTEADGQKQQREIQNAERQLLVDVSGQSFQSLSEESQNFFKTKWQPEILETLQQMSYFGLSVQMNRLCIVEHKEFLRKANCITC